MGKTIYTEEQIKEIAKNLYDFLMAESSKKREQIKKEKYPTTKSRVEMMTILPYFLDEFDVDPSMYSLDELCMLGSMYEIIKDAVEQKVQTLKSGEIRRMVEEGSIMEKQ